MTDKEFIEQQLEQTHFFWCGCLNGLLVSAFIVLIILLLTSCKTQYVPVETVVKEYVHSVDTVYERDTVTNEKETIVRMATSADSVMLAKLGLQLDESNRIILVLKSELERQSHERQESRTDTIYRDKEVQVPYPVERKLTKWESFCIDYGKITIGATIILIITAIVAIVICIRRWLSKK